MRDSIRVRAVDLFAGCGGLSLGLAKAGFEVVGAVEIDATACRAFKANHPKVHMWRRNICTLSAPTILKKLGLKVGELDLLAGCPPCQGFSTLRTLNGKLGIVDKQNDLIFQFLRLVKGLRPKAVMLENVPALAKDIRFLEFKQSLAKMGYRVNAAIKDAQNYGVPQRRKRLIMLAAADCDVPFAEPDAEKLFVRHAIAQLPNPGTGDDPIHVVDENRSQSVRSIIALIPKDGGSRTDLPAERQLACHKRCNGFKDVYGRMAWDKVAPTITTGCFNPSKGRFLHPEADRSITMREAAVLQGFPPDYNFSR